tara:strand:+ start:1666 stop:1884 length:219 start_codon:yes stop_codon:yes gene_type:complete
MEELEKRLADSLLFHIDTVRKQHTRIRDDSYAIDYLRREIRSLKKEINKQEKWIQKLEFKNRLLGVSKEIKN